MGRPSAVTAIGLMSGTSMDGVDAALIATDGEDFVAPGAWISAPYPDELRRELLHLKHDSPAWSAMDAQLTDFQSDVAKELCRAHGVPFSTVRCVGFHGQTILHQPAYRRTYQLGDGARMAHTLRCTVVNRFRDNDLLRGGEGAPLVPVYHRALVRATGCPEPVAVLNVGGVSNVTFIDGGDLIAFDCGPGNALLDDWMLLRTEQPYDRDGATAARGKADVDLVRHLMGHPYFKRSGTKSLDRNEFQTSALDSLGLEDGAATLVAFTVEAIVFARDVLPRPPRSWIVAGGGRLNLTLLSELRARLGAPVLTAEEVGWAGGALEAQAFGYLAVRSLAGLPLTCPPRQASLRPHPVVFIIGRSRKGEWRCPETLRSRRASAAWP